MKNFHKNYGRIIMTILFILYVVFLTIYIFKERKKININIQLILKNDFDFNVSQNSDKKILNINNFDKSNIKNPPHKSVIELKKLNIPENDNSKNNILFNIYNIF